MKQQKQRLMDYLSNNDFELMSLDVEVIPPDVRLDEGSIGSSTPMVHAAHHYEVKFTLQLTAHELCQLERDPVLYHMRLAKRIEQEWEERLLKK